MNPVRRTLLFLITAACLAAGCSNVGKQSRWAMLPTDALLPRCELSAQVDIPESCWGPAIRVLTPLRVRRDMVNVAVVTAETSSEETGVYFVVPKSSYLPVD